MAIVRLQHLYARFVSKTDRLTTLFETPLSPLPCANLCDPIHTLGKLRLIVKLQHIWAEFCRRLITESALGHGKTLGGVTLTAVAGVANPEDVQKLARKHSGGSFPPWHLPSFSVPFAVALSVANSSQIAGGLGAVSPVNDLAAIRNYIVHPNEITRARYSTAIAKMVPGWAEPETVLAAKQPGGVTLFGVWIADLQLSALDAAR